MIADGRRSVKSPPQAGGACEKFRRCTCKKQRSDEISEGPLTFFFKRAAAADGNFAAAADSAVPQQPAEPAAEPTIAHKARCEKDAPLARRR